VAVHGRTVRNSYSAGNYQLMDDEATIGIIPLRTTTSNPTGDSYSDRKYQLKEDDCDRLYQIVNVQKVL
jgi:hypothetical protein